MKHEWARASALPGNAEAQKEKTPPKDTRAFSGVLSELGSDPDA